MFGLPWKNVFGYPWINPLLSPWKNFPTLLVVSFIHSPIWRDVVVHCALGTSLKFVATSTMWCNSCLRVVGMHYVGGTVLVRRGIIFALCAIHYESLLMLQTHCSFVCN